MFTRILSSAVTALTVTTGLLYLMHYLIEISEAAVTEKPGRYDLAWLRTVEDTPVIPKRQRQSRPNPPPETPPIRPPVDATEDFVGTGPRPAPVAPPGGGWQPTGIRYTDGGLMTIVAVKPSYPQLAIQRGLEGHVIVRFDVTEMGTVHNVEVVESSNRIFDKAAIKAAMRFRFKPKIIDGVPQVSYGVQRMFTFRMDQN